MPSTARFRPREMERSYGDFQNVVSGQTATFNVPRSGIHRGLMLRFKKGASEATKAEIAAQISKIEVKVNGNQFLDLTPAELHMIQDYYGAAHGDSSQDGLVVINWDRPHLADAQSRLQYGLGMADVTSYSVNVQCGTLTNIDKISAYVSLVNADAPAGTHLRYKKIGQTFSGTGQFDMIDLPKAPGTAIAAIHMDLGSGTLTDSSLVVDDIRMFENRPPLVTKSRNAKAGRTNQTGYEHIDFGTQNGPVDFLEMVAPQHTQTQDLRLQSNWSVAPGQHDYIVEQIYNLPGFTAA